MKQLRQDVEDHNCVLLKKANNRKHNLRINTKLHAKKKKKPGDLIQNLTPRAQPIRERQVVPCPPKFSRLEVKLISCICSLDCFILL